jgi:hypothetical protein
MIRTVKEIVDLARVELQDAPKKFYSDAELVEYMNGGRQLMYVGVPRLYEVTEVMALSEGSRQTVPNASRRLIGLIENVTADSRRVITPIKRDLLSRIRPSWRAEDPSDEILHFDYTETEPTVFETYPPAMAGTQVRISYAKPPVKLLAADYTAETPLTAEADMGEALIHWVVHRAFAKQSDTSPDAGQRSAAALQAFNTMIGAEATGKMDSSPNTLAIAGKPTEATNR